MRMHEERSEESPGWIVVSNSIPIFRGFFTPPKIAIAIPGFVQNDIQTRCSSDFTFLIFN